MFADALGYPTAGDDSVRTILVGGLLTAFGLFVLPLLPVLGYCVSAVRGTLAGHDRPPAFDDVGALSRDGAVALGVVFVYMLVPTVVTAAVVLATGGIGAMSSDSGVAVLSVIAGLFLGFAVGSVLVLLFSYVAFAAVINYAEEGTVSAAFDAGTILEVAGSGPYLKGWLVGVVGIFAGALVSFAINSFLGVFFGIFGLIPIVGALISLFGLMVQWTVAAVIGFYVTLGSFRAAAVGFRSALAP